MSLDIDLLRTFAAVADTASFTAAGHQVGATQSAVSVRLKKLEERLGRPLLERTPRSVELTTFGSRFLVDARRVLAAHDDALRRALVGDTAVSLSIGVSEHAGGLSLARALAEVRGLMPRLTLKVMLGLSDELTGDYEAGRLDAIVIRRTPGPGAGRVLYRDDLVFVGAPDLDWRPGEPVPLVSVDPPCNTRQAAIRALDEAGVPWTDAFVSRGVAAVQAAAAAGLGIACLGRRFRPEGTTVLGRESGLPALPESEVAVLDSTRDAAASLAVRRIADALTAVVMDEVSR
ncbi:LysR substrate-binding domain-containing protein [Chthonobacter rhizosphaerae]|uniref:LysR substrate-binding domain-containing protein n=1 Tax=Chthonobacter rhizosphaerae TaxID=2735553 RepID=UPI0015EECC02|nr:LysR substrate-binding domain-containing protein [Chthonobacter rhizosphaerae]